MTLKITFESDTRGFEQVSKALEQQQKLLNENAAAAERLNRAQKGIFDTDSPASKRSLDYFKETAKSIKDITGALSQLDRSQGGLQSFMNLFSNFRKDLNEASKDQKNNIFTNLATQIDTLKKSISASSLSVRDIKKEISDLEVEAKADPNNTFTQDRLRNLKASMLDQQQSMTREQHLLNNARMLQMMQQPIGSTMAGMGGPFGFMNGMGPTPAGMMKLAAYGTAAYYGAKFLNNTVQNFARGDELADIGAYQSRMQINEAAMSGRGGEAFMRSRQLGGYNEAAKTFSQKASDFFATALQDTMTVFTRFQLPFITDQQGMTDAERAEFQAKRNRDLSARQIDAYDRTSNLARQNLLSGEFGRMESQFGYGAARYMQGQLSRSGISLGEASSTLELAARAGLSRSSLITMAPQLMANSSMLGISDNLKFQLFRQAANGQPSAIISALSGFEQFLGGIQNTGIDVRSNFQMREQASDYIASLQGQFGLPVSADRAGGRFLGALQQTAGSGLSASDRIKAAADMDQMTRARIGNTNAIESMGINAMLMRSGISPYARAMIMERLATDPEKAAEAISKLTGRSVNDVKQEVGGIFKGVQSFRRDLTGADTEKGRAEDKILKEAFGVSLTGFMQTGTTMGATSVAMSQVDAEGLNPFGKAVGPAAPIAISDQDTQQRKTKAAEAKQQENLMQQFEDIAKRSGGTVASVLTETFEKYTSEITDALEKIKSELPAKFQDSNPSPNKAAPTGSVTGAGARGK